MIQKKKTYLNFIFPPRKNFRTIDIFTKYVEKRLRSQKKAGKLEPTDSYFVLFHETPFGRRYFPKRADVKVAIKKLGILLQKEFPNVRVGFSINEQVLRGKQNEKSTFSNTGYLVGEGKGGYEVYPKLRLKYGDTKTIKLFAGNQRTDEVKAHWHSRSTIVSNAEMPFPRANFDTNHEVEYRVCADSDMPTTKEKIITAISANGLPPKKVDPAVLSRDLVILNDKHYGLEFHTPLRKVRIDSKMLKGSYNAHLARRRIRVHRWK